LREAWALHQGLQSSEEENLVIIVSEVNM